MFLNPLSSRSAELCRGVVWAAVAIGSVTTLGLAWRSVLLTVAVALGG